MDEFYDQEESRNWTAYYDSSSENFSIDIDNFTCEIIIFAGITNINTTEYMNMEWVVLGPCGNNGILGVEIEIFGAWMEVPSFHSEDLWDDMIHLDEGTYNMSWTKPSGYFTSGNDYLIEYMREINEDFDEGSYNWTAGSGSGIGLGSQDWNITVYEDTCKIINDGVLWEAEYFSNGTWDKENSTFLSAAITDMEGPGCEDHDDHYEPEWADNIHLYYDNGSGPVLWEMEIDTMYFEDCTDVGEYYECTTYDGETMYFAYEDCEYENTTMEWSCVTGYGEPPMLEAGDYTFTLNVTDLEVGTNYSLDYEAYTHSLFGESTQS